MTTICVVASGTKWSEACLPAGRQSRSLSTAQRLSFIRYFEIASAKKRPRKDTAYVI